MASARAVAWAQLWDSEKTLSFIKLQVHTAVGAELKKIPVELDRALRLKSQLLQASLAYLDILSAGVTARNDDVQHAHSDLLRWSHHLEALEDAGLIQVRANVYQEVVYQPPPRPPLRNLPTATTTSHGHPPRCARRRTRT